MRNVRLGLCLWVLILAVVLTYKDSSGLIIYRFGGQALPPPSDAESEGVEFIQKSWSDLNSSQGGETFQLVMEDNSIKAFELDPQENIAPTIEERGGRREYGAVDYVDVFDGDLTTVHTLPRYLCAEKALKTRQSCLLPPYDTEGLIQISLNGLFLIDRIRIISGLLDPDKVVQRVRVYTTNLLVGHRGVYHEMEDWIQPSDAVHGSAHIDNSIYSVLEVKDNMKQYLDIEPAPIRTTFIQLTVAEHNVEWEIAEVEVYAKGFLEESSYVSDRIDFGIPAAWGDIRWSGSRDPGAKVLIQTRSGADDDPTMYWKNTGRGGEKKEVTRSRYNRLNFGEKAGTTHDRDNWTLWSQPYDFADSLGTSVVSLSPRRFVQFKVDFFPLGEAGGGLDFLEFRASVPPSASKLVGEISPVRVEVGKVSRFTYAVKPTIEGDDRGFDSLEMTTASTIMSVNSVRIDDVDVPFEVEALEENEFEVSIPRIGREDSGALIEVVFDAKVLRYGSSFNARVFDSSRPWEVHQGVGAGDAKAEFEENSVSVITSVEDKSVLEVSVSPETFTPNGDGINDVAIISYDIFEITVSVFVTVEIRDLSGNSLRKVYSGDDPIGHHEREWDGRDDSGEIVPPGVYVYQVSMEADKGNDDKAGTVDVAY